MWNDFWGGLTRVRPSMGGASFLFFMLCLAAGASRPAAQEVTALSKGEGSVMPVLQRFDPKSNVTVVEVSLGILDYVGMVATTARGENPFWPGRQVRQGVILASARYAYPGKVPARPGSVELVFTSNRVKDKYAADQGFSVSADGAVAQEGKFVLGRHDIRVEDEGTVTLKLLTVSVPTDAFLTIARAKKVQFKLGPETYKLSGDERKNLRALAAAIEGSPGK